jgi:hypothetical protein
MVVQLVEVMAVLSVGLLVATMATEKDRETGMKICKMK